MAIDANILIADPWLHSQNIRILLDFVRKTRSKILLHEIVEQEAHAHFRRNCLNAIESVRTSLRELARYRIAGIPDFNAEESLTHTLETYEGNFRQTFHGHICRRLPLDTSALPEALRRAVERIPPCSPKGEGIRDAIIWLNLLALYKARTGEVAFVSADTGDFAMPDKRSLRTELLADAEALGVRIAYFSSLSDFVRDRAKAVAHISKDWIKERLNTDEVKSLVDTFLSSRGSHLYKIANFDYRELYEPVGKPSLFSLDVEFDDVYIWEFDDKHVELELEFVVDSEADMSCELKAGSGVFAFEEEDHSRWKWSFDQEEQPRRKTLVCSAELGCSVSAELAGDNVTLLDIEDIFRR